MSDAIEAAAKALISAQRDMFLGGGWFALDDAKELARAALTAYEAAKGGGAVKPLEWSRFERGQTQYADTIFGRYEAWDFDGSSSHYKRPGGHSGIPIGGDIDAAKAAAFAHYEAGIRSALTSPASGSAQPRSFWMHYDHQSGRWVVDDRPPNVVRTGSEVIHVLEVLPTSPASGERDAVTQAAADVLAARMQEALKEAERFMAYFAGETNNEFVGPGTPATCLATIRAALVGADYSLAPAHPKPVAWRARRYGSSEWEVFGYDPRALKQFSFFEPLYASNALGGKDE
jgi:hypothetical protein